MNGFTCGKLRRRQFIDSPGEREMEKELRALLAFMLGIGHGKGEGSTYIHGNMDTYVTEKGGWEAVHRMQNQLRSKQKSTTRRVRDKVLII